MGLDIRRLTKGDLASIKALCELFGKVFNDAESYLNHKPSDQYLAKFLENDNNIVITVSSEGKVGGGLVAYCLTKFESERKEVFLYDLAVAEHLQRQGVGRKLIDALKQISKDTGAYIVFVQADEDDEAVKFYESLGPSENLKTRNFDFNV